MASTERRVVPRRPKMVKGCLQESRHIVANRTSRSCSSLCNSIAGTSSSGDAASTGEAPETWPWCVKRDHAVKQTRSCFMRFSVYLRFYRGGWVSVTLKNTWVGKWARGGIKRAHAHVEYFQGLNGQVSPVLPNTKEQTRPRF